MLKLLILLYFIEKYKNNEVQSDLYCTKENILNKKVRKFLGRAFNTWQVEILVPKDVRNQFVHGVDKPKSFAWQAYFKI